MKQWIKGGPFFEVFFVVENKGDKIKFVNDFLKQLKKIPQKFTIESTKLDAQIKKFSKGYPLDKSDPDTRTIHQLQVNLLISVSGKRKAILYFEQIASDTMQINFCFFGSGWDAREWNQKGIKDKDLPKFTDFLTSLYKVFEFPIGGISVENDAVLLFYDSDGCDVLWSNDLYKLKNINIRRIIKNFNKLDIIDCVFDSKFFKVKKIPSKAKKIGKGGILIKKLFN